MGFGDTSLLCKIVLVLLIFCFIIDLIGFAIPYWYSVDLTISGVNVKSFGGLWDLCAENGNIKTCASLTNNGLADWFRAVRAFSILSWLFFLAALVFVIVYMFFLSDKKMLYLVAVCLTFVGALCALIAFAVYAGESSGVLKEYHAAFSLTIISFILGLIIGVFGILDYFGCLGGI
ncbi:hypothetical protein CHS0354_039775 [Potamilus streckersoni]|uniref:Uncharacterized protein n=1 Tax=Potamilus streckersoni TaxID=2493646 RepID=A0AAE0RZZ1_9BIVA|nr:hypothetical protein CHS0354_039775 [Potamilus streckersoni]